MYKLEKAEQERQKALSKKLDGLANRPSTHKTTGEEIINEAPAIEEIEKKPDNAVATPKYTDIVSEDATDGGLVVQNQKLTQASTNTLAIGAGAEKTPGAADTPNGDDVQIEIIQANRNPGGDIKVTEKQEHQDNARGATPGYVTTIRSKIETFTIKISGQAGEVMYKQSQKLFNYREGLGLINQ